MGSLLAIHNVCEALNLYDYYLFWRVTGIMDMYFPISFVLNCSQTIISVLDLANVYHICVNVRWSDVSFIVGYFTEAN